MKNDQFGDRMKMYEKRQANNLMPQLPAMARLDGKNFSKFTKGLKRPFDERLVVLMQGLTSFLVNKTGADMGYTQSDEITLTWYASNPKSQIYFDGRLFKMISTLSALASTYFNKYMLNALGEKQDMYIINDNFPIFDCRVWNVPNLIEGSNVFLWREMDATKNSIAMLAQSFFSHRELMNKNCSAMFDMLMDAHGVNWNDYPSHFKRGTFIQKRKLISKLTGVELKSLPEKHDAHKNPDLEFERTFIGPIDMPSFSKVVNRVGVIYNGEDPRTESNIH